MNNHVQIKKNNNYNNNVQINKNNYYDSLPPSPSGRLAIFQNVHKTKLTKINKYSCEQQCGCQA